MQLNFHGPFDKIAGSEVEIRLAAPTDLRQILYFLKSRYPEMGKYLIDKDDEMLGAHIMFLRGGSFLRLADMVYEEDQVDVLLPVVGG